MTRKKQSAINKPFGGAKTIYVARIEKESVQDTTADRTGVQYLQRPLTANGEDAIEYLTKTVDFNSFHSRCLQLKADVTVGLGINLIKAPDAFHERIEVVNALGESLLEVVTRVSLDYETCANAYLEIVVGRGGTVEELYHMPPARMYRRPRGAETAYFYMNEDTGVMEPLAAWKPEEATEPGSYILSFKQASQTSRHYGLPDWRGALPDIELDYYSVLYNQKFFINSGIPDMAIVVEGGEFDKATQDQVVNFLQGSIKGLANAHRTLYLPVNDPNVKVRFDKLGMDVPRDASFDKLRSRCRDNIISAHGVYPRLIGVVTSGQLGGSGEAAGQLKTFQEIYVAPRQKMWETKLTPVLSAMGFGDIEFSFEEMDTAIQEAASQYYPAMVSARILTVEKSREELGYEIDMIGDKERQKREDAQRDQFQQRPEERILETLEKLEKML